MGDLAQLEANGGYHEHLRGIRLFFPGRTGSRPCRRQCGLHETSGKLKAVESTLREKKDLQKQLLAYIKTKPARDGLKAQKTEKARKNYREQHESDFIIAEAATRYFKAQGIQNCQRPKPYNRD